ncbi:hypothetical protein J3R83DRAFT_12091 [Lanmaoa asiatica]|nr:hypothetical protein J3R83DRAFT_12091 [Lanmaoa asiatica]
MSARKSILTATGLSTQAKTSAPTFSKNSRTGIFQPADVGLNRVIKHRLKQHQTEYLVETHQQQINSGLTAE